MGRTHFSRDVIFNESSAGRRVRLPRSLPPPSDLSSRPSRQRILDVAGDAFAEALDFSHSVRSARNAVPGGASDGGVLLRRSNRIAAKLPLAASAAESLSADLIAMTTCFPGTVDIDLVSLLSLESDALCALLSLPSASPSPSSPWDLRKPPRSYAEACARSDAPAWRAAMDR